MFVYTQFTPFPMNKSKQTKVLMPNKIKTKFRLRLVFDPLNPFNI